MDQRTVSTRLGLLRPRTVILVSGAAATFSITFVEKLTSGEPTAPWMLLVAWSMFALSVKAITLSHLLAAMGAAAADTVILTVLTLTFGYPE
ncbi:MAG: hypothetical protein WEB67_12145 [Acidimicrobiia bacterium]